MIGELLAERLQNAPQLMTTPPLLTINDVSKRFGKVVALQDVSATVYPGEVLGIVGESGSGKSTLLRMMNLEDTPDSGDYRLALPELDGNLFDLDRFARRMLCARHIGIVYQNPHLGLLMGHTSSGNVAERLLIAGERSFAELRSKAREALDASEFPLERMDARPIELSGGMQQRVGLARAFATDADILLMDEPFSALDPLIRTKLQDELLGLQKELKKTIIFVSHDLEEALKIGDRIAIMENARIVQVGPPEDIVLKPATPYVREFVANVNPLSVLTAYNVMRDQRDLPREDGWTILDRRRTTRFKVGVDGRVIACERDGRPATWLAVDEPAPGADQHVVFWARLDTPLKNVMLAMHRDAAPVGVFDAADRFVGAIGVRDVLQAVVRGENG